MIKKLVICLNYGHFEEKKLVQLLYLKITISTKSLMSIPFLRCFVYPLGEKTVVGKFSYKKYIFIIAMTLLEGLFLG